ncbi:MAG: esterase family protein [Simkaniaceae bacterium]|nr:esterase family protein [Simkaniaceae bacterium]
MNTSIEISQINSFQELFDAVKEAPDEASLSCSRGSVTHRVSVLFREAIEAKYPTDFSRFHHKIEWQLVTNANLKKGKFKTADAVKRLHYQLHHNKITVGKSPEVFTREMEARKTIVTNMVRYLVTEKSMGCKNFTCSAISAILIKKSQSMLNEAVHVFQEMFDNLYNAITPENSDLSNMLLGNLLSLLPFFEPKVDTIFQIPQRIDGNWQKVPYKVSPISLTPKYLGSPLKAYGFTTEVKEAKPLLVCIGTTQPTTTGSQLTYWTDFVPGMTVGESLYTSYSKNKLDSWLRHNSGAKMFGQSLGGITAIMSASDNPQHVSEVHAYGSPSPLHSVRAHFTDNTRRFGVTPDVNVYCQDNDAVKHMGTGWHKDWKVWNVVTPNRHNFFSSHAKAFTGQSDVLVMEMIRNSGGEKRRRWLVNFFHQLVSIPMVIVQTLALIIKGYAIGLFNMIKHSVACKARA